jgi:ABC-2 type transport system permease protein
MNKIFLIIQREYLVRVRKPIFIIMTLLGPLLMCLPYALTFYFLTRETEVKNIMLLDESGLMGDTLKGTKSLKLNMLKQVNLPQAKEIFKNSNEYALVYVPKMDLKNLGKVEIFTKKNISIEVQEKIKDLLSQELERQRYLQAGVNKEMLKNLEVNLAIKASMLEGDTEKSSSAAANAAIGFGGAFFLYILLFIYGVQVMRGVLEEKTSRIMEVIVSSVKPFQLMMGKIIGIGLVGLTQFLVWILLATLLTTGISYLYKDKLVEKAKTEQAKNQNLSTITQPSTTTPKLSSPLDFLASMNVPLLIGGFLFYFLGGYFLYSSLFAAIGSAADAETDTQQFMFPVTIPIVVSFIAAQFVIREPDGPVAFWLSMIPLTSPIIMMVRLPFNPEWWELALSMVLLVAGFIGTTWLAARIYRVGVLMYGKKPTYKELVKWISYRS